MRTRSRELTSLQSARSRHLDGDSGTSRDTSSTASTLTEFDQPAGSVGSAPVPKRTEAEAGAGAWGSASWHLPGMKRSAGKPPSVLRGAVEYCPGSNRRTGPEAG